MTKDKKPSDYDMFNDDSIWGNQTAGDLSHSDIVETNWNYKRTKAEKEKYAELIREAVKTRDYLDWYKKNTARLNDPEWIKNNKKKSKERWANLEWVKKYYENLGQIKSTPEYKNSIKKAIETRTANLEWRKNIAEVRRKQAKDPNWHKAMMTGYNEFFNSDEGKKLRKKTGEKNKNNPQFKRNVLIGRKVFPFYTPWGYYYDANIAAKESKIKNNTYFFKTRSKNKTYCCAAKIRKLLKESNNKDFYFITWDEYDELTK